ncbi:MAG TPA: glycosyltransferase [Anaerolineales bacterium]|nr:glycosyltransferase [Anaerolineales bacterium]
MKPLVSVITITYNHAPYIRNCIEGVLMQKTTFPFEHIIGEDCSTDGTREIVLDYAQRYPGIIRAVTSESNVGVKANAIRVHAACQGEYFAYCDGDDFWIDPLKLQKQYDACVKYDAGLVAHGTIFLIYENNKIVKSEVRSTQDESGYLAAEDIILKNKNYELSSMFIRSDILKKLPRWIEEAPTGDVPIKLISASLGKVYFINEIMSVYRYGVWGSWTSRQDTDMQADESKRIGFEKAYLGLYKNFDEFSGFRYTSAVRQRVRKRLENYYNNYGNLNCLDISDAEKKRIKLIAALSRFVPIRWRDRIVKSQVDKYLPFA